MGFLRGSVSPQPLAAIENFEGPYRFLSNFASIERGIEFEGRRYPSVENAYQAAKTFDPALRAQIAAATPGQAKRMGQKLGLRPDWERVKLALMADLVSRKFSHEPFRSALLATGDAVIIEGNPWGDRFWGVCDGSGANHLGLILTRVRADLRARTR